MRKILNVRGTQSEVSELEVNIDTVYSRTNIQRIETEDFTGWQYDETQYAKDEYLSILAEKEIVNKLDSKVELLEINNDETVLGVIEAYQEQKTSNLIREEENLVSATALIEAYELILLLSNRIDNLEAKI